MEKELYMKGESPKKILVKHDDLRYDGKTLLIPSYWASTIADYLKSLDETKISEEDKEDLETFKCFIFDVECSQTDGN
jgi:hypothetical protein